MASVPPESIIELDQEDIAGRIAADSYFDGVMQVLLQRRGITENDIAIAISATNSVGGVAGSVVIVMMPSLAGVDPNAPGPRYWVKYGVQVIDWPIVRRQVIGGTQTSAEEIADRLREILHTLNLGRGQVITFDSVIPVPVQEGQVSYMVYFKRLGSDQPPTDVAAVKIVPLSGIIGQAPTILPGNQTVTLTCATVGAAIWYSTDGTYPSAVSATSVLYTGPFTVPVSCTLRAAAQLSGYQQSKVISTSIYGPAEAAPIVDYLGNNLVDYLGDLAII